MKKLDIFKKISKEKPKKESIINPAKKVQRFE